MYLCQAQLSCRLGLCTALDVKETLPLLLLMDAGNSQLMRQKCKHHSFVSASSIFWSLFMKAAWLGKFADATQSRSDTQVSKVVSMLTCPVLQNTGEEDVQLCGNKTSATPLAASHVCPAKSCLNAQEKQRKHHASSPTSHSAEPGQSVAEDAAHLSAFCASRPDTAHLAHCFANLAHGQQGLSAPSKDNRLATHSSNTSQLASERVAIVHDDKTEADGQADIEAGKQGSQSEAAPERHQPNLSEAIEELTERFQMMLHLPSAQACTARMM